MSLWDIGLWLAFVPPERGGCGVMSSSPREAGMTTGVQGFRAVTLSHVSLWLPLQVPGCDHLGAFRVGYSALPPTLGPAGAGLRRPRAAA